MSWLRLQHLKRPFERLTAVGELDGEPAYRGAGIEARDCEQDGFGFGQR
jgi:hypothetical protein